MGIGGPGKYSMPLGPGTGPGPAPSIPGCGGGIPCVPGGKGCNPCGGNPRIGAPRSHTSHRRPRAGHGPHPARSDHTLAARVLHRVRLRLRLRHRRRPRFALFLGNYPPVLALHPKTLNVHARARGARETRTLAAVSDPSAVAGVRSDGAVVHDGPEEIIHVHRPDALERRVIFER